MYEHWLVEYWHPGAGWVWLESSLGQFRPLPCSLVVLNVANPEDEDRAFDPLQCRQVMPGAPHLSVHVGSDELYRAPKFARRLAGAGNLASIETRLNGTEEELAGVFRAARGAFEALVRESEKGLANAARTESVRKALQSKKATDLTAVLKRMTAERELGVPTRIGQDHPAGIHAQVGVGLLHRFRVAVEVEHV